MSDSRETACELVVGCGWGGSVCVFSLTKNLKEGFVGMQCLREAMFICSQWLIFHHFCVEKLLLCSPE